MSMALAFAAVIAVIFLVGSFMYIIIMGPSRYHRDGYVGKTYRMIKSIPIALGGCCCSIFYGCNHRKGRARCARCTENAINERNWYMVIFYFVLVWTVEILYLFFALPKLKSTILSKLVSWGLVVVSEVLYLMAIFADPGVVSKRSQVEAQREHAIQKLAKGKRVPAKRGAHRGAGNKSNDSNNNNKAEVNESKFPRFSAEAEYVLNRRYVVDGMLYALAGDDAEEDHTSAEMQLASATGHQVGFSQACHTCKVLRPSRSKHCRMCNTCVRRFDHHCPWINNDVAEGTHRYFLGFLLVHAISCTWACYDLFRCIRQFLVERRAWGWVLVHSGRVYHLHFVDYMAIVVNYLMLEGCLLFFAFFISLVLYGFWAYQMSFVFSNVTMNDVNKMDDVASFVEELSTLELVYREAIRVRTRLREVAERKPRALEKLVEPPPPPTEKGYEEGGKKNKKYRKQVRKMVMADLMGIFDKGIVANVLEVLFPYSVLTRDRLEEMKKYAQ